MQSRLAVSVSCRAGLSLVSTPAQYALRQASLKVLRPQTCQRRGLRGVVAMSQGDVVGEDKKPGFKPQNQEFLGTVRNCSC